MNRWARRYYPLMLATLSLTFVYLFTVTDRKDLVQQSVDTSVSINPHGNTIGGSNLRQFIANHQMKRSEYHVEETGRDNLPPINQLLDMDYFKFLKNCSNLCSSSTNTSAQPINLLAFVHTSPINFSRRRIIRRTWASPSVQQLLAIKVIFLVGLPNNTETQAQLDLESSRYGDLVQGNFVDSYKNLTYKHLMGYKWVLTYCRSAKFIMKIDDDAFVDIFRVVSLLKQTFGADERFHGKDDKSSSSSSSSSSRPNGIISCSLFPEGSFVKRQGKWRLSPEDYPFDTFPAYCSGIGYFLTPDVAQDLYLASSQVRPFLWIDDLFITGILVAQFPLRHQPINFKFTYSPSDLRKWLKVKEKKPCPYIIGDIGDTLDWETLMIRLWDKTRSYFVP